MVTQGSLMKAFGEVMVPSSFERNALGCEIFALLDGSKQSNL